MKHSPHPRFVGRHAAALFFLALPVGPARALPPHAPVPGGIAVLAMGDVQAPTVRFNDRQQAVIQEGGRWFALIGIPLDTSAGHHEVSIEDKGAIRQLGFDVLAKRYPTQHLRIADARLVTPPPELAERISAEQQRLGELKQHYSPQPIPPTAFRLPADGRLSARFGARRVLNGEARAPHAGLDLAVPDGRPVRAAAAGTVLAVENFYFAGRTVVVDHGQGMLTLYAHLSRVDVEVGMAVRQDAPLGRSGASGRATGPHLHWGVILGGTAIDPELLLPAYGTARADRPAAMQNTARFP